MSDIRNDFPFLVKHPEVAYFDNAATSLKPQSVIDAVVSYYEDLSANVHRGDFKESLAVSALFDEVRNKSAKFLNCQFDEVVFTSGASESLNLMAHMVSESYLNEGDVVLLNEAEHASNILPWFHLAEKHGFKIEFIPLSEGGRLSAESFEKALHDRVKLVSIAHISNVLGHENDIATLAKIAHSKDVLICVDGAQSIGHTAVDVKALDVDFYAYSAHKMLGPSGVGVLYGKIQHLNSMSPLKMGGGSNVRFNSCGDIVLKKSPLKFESGTPNIEGVLGYGAAIDYLTDLGFDKLHELTSNLHKRLLDGLAGMDHIEVMNPDADVAIVSLSVDGIFAQDVASYLSTFNISVRAGEHCAKLLNGALHHEKTVRVSIYFYNSEEEIDRLIEVLKDITLEKVIDHYL